MELKKYPDEYWNEILKLKEKYHGREDDYIETCSKNTYKPKMKYYGTFSLDEIKKNVFVFPKINCNKYAYKNLRSNNKIIDCQLEQNGKTIDKIYGEIFPILKLIYGIINENILPFYFCKDDEFLLPSIWNTRLIISADEKCNFEVDIYEINNDSENKSNMIIKQVQTNGKEIVNGNSSSKFRLNFINITDYIIIYLSKETIYRFCLSFNGMDVPIAISDMIFYNGQYIIPLAKFMNNKHGINFSNINSIWINIWFDKRYHNIKNRYVTIYGISNNIININSIKSNLIY